MQTAPVTRIMDRTTGKIAEWCGQPAVFDTTWTREMIHAAYRQIAGAPSMSNPWVIVLPNGFTTKAAGYDF